MFLEALVQIRSNRHSSLSPASVHVFSLVHVLVRGCHVAHFLLLIFEDILDPGPCPGVHHVMPVLVCVGGQLLPPLYDEDAGVADLAMPHVLQLEAAYTVILILLAVGEPGAIKTQIYNDQP